jgi:hypothetical protein
VDPHRTLPFRKPTVYDTLYFGGILTKQVDMVGRSASAGHCGRVNISEMLSGSKQVWVVPIHKGAGEAMPPSNLLTGLASFGRMVWCPGR